MNKLFPCMEIGSLSKPSWRVKSIKNAPILETDIKEAVEWGEKLGINYSYLLKTLRKKNKSEKEKKEITNTSSFYAIKLFEKTGLDILYNGEQTRSEMYQHPLQYIKGINYVGEVRSWDNKYYLKGVCIEEPELIKPYDIQEFNFVKNHTKKMVKFPITGAYTLADWSYNEFYVKKQGKNKDKKKTNYNAKRELTIAIAKNIIRPVIKKLIENGCKWIQIDEPAATTKSEEIPIFVESFNESVKGLNAKFSCHICFSDYSLLFPDILEMKKCSQFAWEFANRDDNKRQGYKDLLFFKEYNDHREIGLGVIDVHNNKIETPQLIRNRILYASKILSAEKIYVTPDCGLRTRNWNVTEKKLSSMVKGAKLARKMFE